MSSRPPSPPAEEAFMAAPVPAGEAIEATMATEVAPAGERLNDELTALLEGDSDLSGLMEGIENIGPAVDAVPLDIGDDLSAKFGLMGDMGGLGGLGDLGMSLDLPGLAQGLASGLTPGASKEETERERMNMLVSHFDEQQMARYAAFRRANIRRAAVKKYASQLLNQPISNNVAVVLAGMSKVLVGDIIELARELQDKDQARERRRAGIEVDDDLGGEPEPILPSYIREAWESYRQRTGTIPGPKMKPGSAGRMF